jgi:hypothetical protein
MILLVGTTVQLSQYCYWSVSTTLVQLSLGSYWSFDTIYVMYKLSTWCYWSVQLPQWCYWSVQLPQWCYWLVQLFPWCYWSVHMPQWCNSSTVPIMLFISMNSGKNIVPWVFCSLFQSSVLSPSTSLSPLATLMLAYNYRYTITL